MSKHILEEYGKIWNENVQKRMKELELNQHTFITKYREKYKTGSQSDVSNWIHVGNSNGKTEKIRNFPDYMTMKKIADILEVSVGYLIGETNFETFDMEKASAYLGLPESTIKSIKKITFAKLSKLRPMKIKALELLLESPILPEYLQNICDLADAINYTKSAPGTSYNLSRAINSIPENDRNDALEYWKDPENAVTNMGIEETDTIKAYAIKLDEAEAIDRVIEPIPDMIVKASEYSLQKAHFKMIESIRERSEFLDTCSRR